MRTPEAFPIYAKRACPAAKIGKARGALLLITSFFLALIPWSLDCVLAETPELGTPFTVKALQSQCYADTPSPGEYPEADLSFIQYLANSAGIANQGDLVTSSIGIVAVTTGINMTKATGAQLGAQLSTSLDSLADAADYPDWTTLTSSQQSAWGSKENYDSAKYNSLLNAFGLGAAAQRYKEGFTGSGGGHGFSFTEQEQNRVNQLGRIANNWISGIGNKVGELKEFFNDKEEIEQWLPASTTNYTVTVPENDYWLNGVPKTLTVAEGTDFQVKFHRGQNLNINRITTSTMTSMVFLVNGNTSFGMYAFSKQPFTYDTYAGFVWDASRTTYKNQTIYYTWMKMENGFLDYQSNVPANLATNIPSGSYDSGIMGYYVLYGDIEGAAGEIQEVEQYPENPSNNQMTWIPAIGIVPNISWPQLTAPNVPTPSESPYNPDFQTDTPEWNNEAATNLLHLSDIKFDKLFPFCLLFDISLLFNKVQSTIVDDGYSYNVLDVPFDYGVDDEDMTVNLTWLHDLALMIRPFVQILLAALLLFVTIWFWKGILAG